MSRVDTGGDGTSIPGSVVEQLRIAGSLAYDTSEGLLVVTNGGSNSITVFHTFGPYVGFGKLVPSGGSTRVSVAVRGDLIYVLDAGGSGAVQGYDRGHAQTDPG